MFGKENEASTRIRVKVCGITNLADAVVAIECGADALGFNFFPGSKRYIDIFAARDWIASLPETVTKVAVVVNPTEAQALELAELPFIDALQLHGAESPGFCQALAERGIAFAKALPVSDENSLRDVPSFSTRAVVLDSRFSGGFGGSGETFPWVFARRFVDSFPKLNVILAGGLTPENVADAVRQVRPFGVDVTTGVEASPGRKDLARLKAFIDAAQG
jgi:phosphoribosylanthranilate isomerase